MKTPLVTVIALRNASATLKESAMFPARYAPILFGFLLSGMMSLIVSGLSTARALGLPEGFALIWAGNWAVSWATAFPVVLIVAPITRRLVARMVTPPSA